MKIKIKLQKIYLNEDLEVDSEKEPIELKDLI